MMKKSHSPFFLVILVVALSLSACGSPSAPEPTQDIGELVNQIAGTIQAGYTQTALAMPTATNTNTPEPTLALAPSATSQPLVLLSPTAAPSPTLSGPTPLPINPATANGCYNAALVADVTVPAGSAYKPGADFTKTWRLVNTGTCDWTADFKITYVGGNLFGADTAKIRQRVAVGGTADISLEMEAPDGLSGTVVSNWQMATDTGSLFGPVLSVSILLPGSKPTATDVGCYSSALVSETIPAGSRMTPGEAFEKTWTIKNTGTCDWTRDFFFDYVGGYDFQGADRVRITKKITPGSTVEISMSIDAPNDPDTYTGSWQMATDGGNFFGQIFTIDIKVK
jgi:hypothetical protein